MSLPAFGEITRKEALDFIEALKAAGGDSSTSAAVVLVIVSLLKTR